MQSALNALNPVLSIREQIHDVLEIHKGLIGKKADDRAKELLSLVDIDYDRLDSYPHQLSGGMKQRMVIAIALAIMPPIIIMDEPTSSLDIYTQKKIYDNLLKLKNITCIVITHRTETKYFFDKGKSSISDVIGFLSSKRAGAKILIFCATKTGSIPSI